MGMWPLWLPGGGSPDPGVAEPGSTEPATPGIGPDGQNPGTYPEGDDSGMGDEPWAGEGEGFPQDSEDNPWAPDQPESQDEGWGWGDRDSGGNGGGGGGGGGGSDWGDIF